MNQNSINIEIEEVRTRIRDLATTRDALTLLVVRLLELEQPTWKVEMASEFEIKLIRPHTFESSIYLQNLWVECEKSPSERLEIVDRWIRILAYEGDDTPAELMQVVPIIRDGIYRSYVKEEDRELIAPHLVGDFWVIYAVDLPDSTTVLKATDALRLGLNAQRLRQHSVENLMRLVTHIEADPYGQCYVLSCENLVYASSLLLLDFVWDKVAELVKGNVVVGIPARDTVLFVGADDAAALVELRQEVAYVFANGHHLISETLLRRTGGVWQVFS